MSENIATMTGTIAERNRSIGAMQVEIGRMNAMSARWRGRSWQ